MGTSSRPARDQKNHRSPLAGCHQSRMVAIIDSVLFAIKKRKTQREKEENRNEMLHSDLALNDRTGTMTAKQWLVSPQ